MTQGGKAGERVGLVVGLVVVLLLLVVVPGGRTKLMSDDIMSKVGDDSCCSATPTPPRSATHTRRQATGKNCASWRRRERSGLCVRVWGVWARGVARTAATVKKKRRARPLPNFYVPLASKSQSQAKPCEQQPHKKATDHPTQARLLFCLWLSSFGQFQSAKAKNEKRHTHTHITTPHARTYYSTPLTRTHAYKDKCSLVVVRPLARSEGYLSIASSTVATLGSSSTVICSQCRLLFRWWLCWGTLLLLLIFFFLI